jgi:hypothetical protein
MTLVEGGMHDYGACMGLKFEQVPQCPFLLSQEYTLAFWPSASFLEQSKIYTNHEIEAHSSRETELSKNQPDLALPLFALGTSNPVSLTTVLAFVNND